MNIFAPRISRTVRYELSLIAFENQEMDKDEVINIMDRYMRYGYLRECELIYNSVHRELEKLK